MGRHPRTFRADPFILDLVNYSRRIRNCPQFYRKKHQVKKKIGHAQDLLRTLLPISTGNIQNYTAPDGLAGLAAFSAEPFDLILVDLFSDA